MLCILDSGLDSDVMASSQRHVVAAAGDVACDTMNDVSVNDGSVTDAQRFDDSDALEEAEHASQGRVWVTRFQKWHHDHSHLNEMLAAIACGFILFEKCCEVLVSAHTCTCSCTCTYTCGPIARFTCTRI